MALLELIAPNPDWTTALTKALERPHGVPERRAERGGDRAGPARRLADDLSWLRAAIEEPAAHGLSQVPDTAAVALWRAELDGERRARLCRLRDRGVLDAAGFLLHETSGP